VFPDFVRLVLQKLAYASKEHHESALYNIERNASEIKRGSYALNRKLTNDGQYQAYNSDVACSRHIRIEYCPVSKLLLRTPAYHMSSK
jgi:hypothetical protein